MSKEFDFSLPDSANNVKGKGMKLIYLFLIVLIIFSIADTVILFRDRPGSQKTNGLIPPNKELKQLALKLENQELNNQAVIAWKEYLQATRSDPPEIARIWYRIGKIRQSEGKYNEALSAYYRSESFSKPADITNEISRRIQECLEFAGRFAALRYELEGRVEGNLSGKKGVNQKTSQNTDDPVVAEIGSLKIRRSDLDEEIEKSIDSQLEGIARFLPGDQLNREKENLFKEYSSNQSRRLFLEQYIIEALLYRKAIDSGLAKKPSVRVSLMDMERSFLASKALEKAYEDNIKITPSDIRTYYETHKEKYTDKAKKRQLKFDKVKERVAIDLIAEKEREVREKLISVLRDKYDVVIHNSVLSSDDNKEKK